MANDVESVFRLVYEDLGIYRNEGNGLWQNRTFCIVGFEHEIPSGAELIKYLLEALIKRGASVVKLPNDKLENKTLSIVDHYLCNYSLGYNALAHDILETKLVTPIWLYTCHRDARIHDTKMLPIFTPVGVFCPLMFAKDDVTIWIVSEMPSKELRHSSDVLSRFARHCGFKIMGFGDTRSVMGQTLDTAADSHIIAYANKHKLPCVAIQWLIDCYVAGEIEDIKKYSVDIQFEATMKANSKKRRISAIDATIAACIQEGRVMCLSYSAAVEATEEVREMIRSKEIKVHVINPLYLLAPWSMEQISGRERTLYNNLSLVDEDRIILYISRQEARNGAFGIFAQISMFMDYCKFRRKKRNKAVRNIEIHPLQDMYLPAYPGVESAISIPEEMLAGDSLVSRGRTRSFNLYDLADSVAFMGDDNALLEEEEMCGPDIHVRQR
ncbi:BRCT domain containg protein,putative [Babesia bigemina]|uniref:BRCT domain containg protein,putative n=1 Tax=Babesia bigemina TaxID=5866 RepID=A0A061D7S0_BABBI|nr:BRCT domain containg protein,putative [Babesia bigemina]CDR94949.1 BRCT domain containg protein,putative [Babesia bigemina]|eukprot:XP_012767135.1 BRCT domain containg protein,putative [Babesia bigemina]